MITDHEEGASQSAEGPVPKDSPLWVSSSAVTPAGDVARKIDRANIVTLHECRGDLHTPKASQIPLDPESFRRVAAAVVPLCIPLQ